MDTSRVSLFAKFVSSWDAAPIHRETEVPGGARAVRIGWPLGARWFHGSIGCSDYIPDPSSGEGVCLCRK